PQLSPVLGHAVLHDLRPVPHGPQVPVDLVHEPRAPMPHLACDGDALQGLGRPSAPSRLRVRDNGSFVDDFDAGRASYLLGALPYLLTRTPRNGSLKLWPANSADAPFVPPATDFPPRTDGIFLLAAPVNSTACQAALTSRPQ